MGTQTIPFQFVQETDDSFLELFPHRYDFIYARHPEPYQKPGWYSEGRYPLSDRQILKGEYLYGVRFDKQTDYFLLDVDASSAYHPRRLPLVLNRIFEALEAIGITDHVVCTSSDTKGLHIYFPLDKSFNSWKLARAVATCLENAGFKFKDGQLEIFPNPKAFNTSGVPSLFKAHRLPVQMGSYILDDALFPTTNSQVQFVRAWRFCQRRNKLDRRRVKALLIQAQRGRSHRLSHTADKFLKDLDIEIEEGWTGHGQTNRLLGRIAMRAFVFHHAVHGGVPLIGQVLVDRIVEVAQALPGYKDWCRHVHEIKDRAQEWARCVERSRYFPYGVARGKGKVLGGAVLGLRDGPSYNQCRAQETQDRIVGALKDLLEKGMLPEGPTARFKALLSYGVGGASLYRYRQLWHPIDLGLEGAEMESADVEEDRELGGQKLGLSVASTGGANHAQFPTSLLLENDSNSSCSKGFGDLAQDGRGRGVKEDSNEAQSVQKIRARIKKQLIINQKNRKNTCLIPAARTDHRYYGDVHSRVLRRMREFLISGDPILMIEVGNWLIKQNQDAYMALIKGCENGQLVGDLAIIARLLAQKKLSPLTMRQLLEKKFGQVHIIALNDFQRTLWIESLKTKI